MFYLRVLLKDYISTIVKFSIIIIPIIRIQTLAEYKLDLLFCTNFLLIILVLLNLKLP